ncbi:MAG: hypothetical protein BMS9Abin26_2120 [Gammaproteobacteria bacterium]|nr:MAG: hypothetical protein BMS9Abin26_2120 [Gammaproteobacteria bacterium]
MVNKKFDILIASNQAESRDAWRDALSGSFSTQEVSNLTLLMDVISHYQPPLMLLDRRLLIDDDYLSKVMAIHKVSPKTRILLMFNGHDDDDIQVDALKAGVKGYCNLAAATPELIVKAIQTIKNDEVWLPRKMIPRIIEELAVNSPTETPILSEQQIRGLETMTPRQQDVVRMVCDGANNKTIANKLSIKERTVKTHLSSIYTKLGVQSRLHLALLLKDTSFL